MEQPVSIDIFQLVDLSLKYLSRRRLAMWPTNWLHRLCGRAPSFPRVQHRIKTGKAGVERLHSLAHCGEGNQEIVGDCVSRLQKRQRCTCCKSKTLELDWCMPALRSVYPIVLVPRRNAPRNSVTCSMWLAHSPRHIHQPRRLVMPSPNAANTSESVYCFALHPSFVVQHSQR